jgi:hypothetical protein
MKPKSVVAEDVMEALRSRYPSGEWALLPQVGNATGGAVRGWADAIAMNLWPSRGLALHGFEIKVSRSDWLRELRRPEKADAFVERCDYWWLAVSEKEIVKPGELPDGWGLLFMHGKTLRCQIDAKRQDRDDLYHRSFLAAILRQANNVVTPDALIRKAEKKGYERGRAGQEATWTYDKEQHEKLRQTVGDFEKASGLRINSYQGGAELGRAVSQVLNGGEAQARRSMENLKATAERIVETTTQGLADLDAAVSV